VIRNESVGLPTVVPGFASEARDIAPLEASWLPKDTLFGRRLYRGPDGFTAQVSAVLMGTDRTSIHKPQYCLDGQGWHIFKSETVAIPMTRPYPYELRAMKLTASKAGLDNEGRPVNVRGIYVYWFVSDKLLTPHHGERMWWMARELVLTGVLQRWAYVSYWANCSPGQEDAAFGRIKDLIAASVPEFQLTAGMATVGSRAAAGIEQQNPSTFPSPQGEGFPSPLRGLRRALVSVQVVSKPALNAPESTSCSGRLLALPLLGERSGVRGVGDGPLFLADCSD
jgi:hypothetical protein